MSNLPKIFAAVALCTAVVAAPSTGGKPKADPKAPTPAPANPPPGPKPAPAPAPEVPAATTTPPTPPAPADDSKLATTASKIGYIFGCNIGKNMKRDHLEVDLDALLLGLKDTLAGTPPRLSQQQQQEVMEAFQKEMEKKQEAAGAEDGAKNEKEGADFLAKNGKRDGVTTTTTGLQYEITKKGTGPKPKASDTVKVHYHGTLLDGTVFDSSVDRGEPATFPVDGVIAGWTEALQLMPVGSKWKLFIPAKLAYGPKGAGDDIGPNATLTFDVELLGIESGADKDK